MKKLLTLALAILMVAALAACGSKTGTGSSSPSDLFTPEPPVIETEAPTEEPAPAVKDAVELMNAIWDSYSGEKFSVVGGSFDAPSETGPAAYTIDAEALDMDFGLPTDQADKVDEVAALRHMMNVNTFTAAAFHVVSTDAVQPVMDALKDGVLNRQWMCGFPDRLTIVRMGDYVISVFGNEELVANFLTATTAAWSTAELVYDEPLDR